VTPELIVSTEGQVGRIRLNRPAALHALTTDMCLGIIEALATFATDDAVAAVVFDHAPSPDGDPKKSRGFCAGGDIRMLADSAKVDGIAARAFFRTEYRMNHRLFTYPKPTVGIMDGITMGGGVGIALPCTYRVATENTRFAMPETGIGLFPDVGGGWYLPRLPGKVGMFVALTGARLDGAECLAVGLATHYIAAAHLSDTLTALSSNADDIAGTLKSHGTGAPIARIVENRTHIDRLFAADSVAGIMAALEADGGAWATKELATMRTKSPFSMAVALHQLREGAAMTDFADVMRMEYRVACRVGAQPDFIEGVRAVVIDKDNAPHWTADASDAAIDKVFARLPADQEWTPL
jgi:enoyl-CoA hydratase